MAKMITRKIESNDGVTSTITELDSFSNPKECEDNLRRMMNEIRTGELRFIFPDKKDKG